METAVFYAAAYAVALKMKTIFLLAYICFQEKKNCSQAMKTGLPGVGKRQRIMNSPKAGTARCISFNAPKLLTVTEK